MKRQPADASASRTSATPPGSRRAAIAGEQRFLLVRPQQLEDVEQQHGGRRFERDHARIADDDLGFVRQPPRAIAATRRRISMPVMRAKHGGGGQSAGQVPASMARFLGEREREPLPAADVDERAAGQEHAGRQRAR